MKKFLWRLSKISGLLVFSFSILFITLWLFQQNELEDKVKNDEYFDVIIKKEEMEQIFFNSILDLSYIVRLEKDFLQKDKKRFYLEIKNFLHLKPSFKSVSIMDLKNQKWIINQSGMNEIQEMPSFDKSLLQKKSIVISPVKKLSDDFPYVYFYARIPLDPGKKLLGWSVLKFDFKAIYKLIEKINISSLGQIVLLDPQTKRFFTPSNIQFTDNIALYDNVVIDEILPDAKDDILNKESNQLDIPYGLVSYDTFHFFPVDHLVSTNKAKMVLGREEVTISFVPLKIISFVPIKELKEYLRKDLKKTLLIYFFSVLLSVLSSFIYLKIKIKQEMTDLILADEREKAINRSKMATIGEMASGIAHEINNPLSVIVGYCEEMQHLAQDSKIKLEDLQEEIKYFSEKMISHSFRMSKIIKGLKNIARSSDSDPMEFYSLDAIMEDVLGVCQQKFHERAIELKKDEIPPSLKIKCRPSEIGQVLLNLVSNACDAVGELEDKKRLIKINFSDFQDYVELAIADSGEGIPEEIRKKIFVPFYTTKKFGKGTGLGLSLSRKIILSHNGDLYLDNLDQGTKFCVRLPKNQA